MKRFFYATTLLCLFTFSPNVSATPITILDTGPGANSPSSGWSLAEFQWLSIRFTMTETNIVTDLLGWISKLSGDDNLTVAVYGDGGTIPDVSNEIFSTLVTTTDSLGWQGARGLDLLLDAGSYWLAFEVRNGATFNGVMPTNIPLPVDYPNDAGYNIWRGEYRGGPIGFGAQVFAREDVPPTEVPEPATALLFGLGSAAALMKKRQLRNKAN